MSKMSSIGLGVLILLALLAITPAAVEVQIGGGSIVGTVKDPAGAAVVGIIMRAVNLETNEASYYEFRLLPNPNATIANFGQILDASGGRNIQLVLKYLF